MMEQLKSALYFPIASYFAFFAKIRLLLWRPKIIVVTGSSGKTTLLHLIQSQVGKNAAYSHHANSAYGIPFDILHLHRKSLRMYEWIVLFVTAPFKTFSAFPKEKVYVVEADADRPEEGRFLANLLSPDITLWLSSARTHSMNFDSLVGVNNVKNVDEAIANEFGNFIEKTKQLAIIDGDNPLITKQASRTNTPIEEVKDKSISSYHLSKRGTTFEIKEKKYSLNALLPKEVGKSVLALIALLEKLNLPLDPDFKNFENPIGRSSLFEGVKNTTMIDSSYNANLSSATAILDMLTQLPSEKWIVMADLLEQGEEEKEEHEKLAEEIARVKPVGVVLIGSAVKTYTLPKLESKLKNIPLIAVLRLDEALFFLQEHIKSGQTILVKGSQSKMTEGIVEHLLKDQKDVKYLPRREKIWIERRKKQGV